MSGFSIADFGLRIGRSALVVVAVALIYMGVPLAADAQQPGRVHRIGVLTNAMPSKPEVSPLWGAFRQELAQRGWVEGQNLIVERRWVEGRVERLPSLAAELVQLKVDLIVAVSGPGARAAKAATSTIPIVMVYVPNPVDMGLVDSLARPGGNVTGVAFVTGPEIAGKYLELLKEAAPKGSRVAVLSYPASTYYASLLQETQAAGRTLGIPLQVYEVEDPDKLESVFRAISKARAGALLVLPHPFMYAHARQIAALAATSRLVAVYPFRECVEAGGLMAYAASASDMYRRAATYVDKILNGEKPADLPVELPTKFEFIVNLKTAKALGLTIPQSILIRADEVIQ